jgi:galacturonosyltransferase
MAMPETIAENRKTMGLAGRKHVEDNFSREIVIKAYEEEIRHIIG